MKTAYLNFIVNQLPVAKHKGLLRWLANSIYGRKLYHKAILSCFYKAAHYTYSAKLDRKTKIAFILLNEFGHILRRRKSYPALVKKVNLHISRKDRPAD